MTRSAVLMLAMSLAGCGYSMDEAALNPNAFAGMPGVAGAPVSAIAPISGEIARAGGGPRWTRSLGPLGSPVDRRFEPTRINRP